MQVTCLNCDTLYEGNFCPECGQRVKTHRVTFETVLHEIPHSFFHLEKGFFFTFKQMSLRPGQAIKEYLAGKRVNYLSPFAYLILLCTITLLLHEMGAYYATHSKSVQINDMSRLTLF